MDSSEYDFEDMAARFDYAIKTKGQKKVCEATGVSPAQAHRIAKAGANPSLVSAAAIAEFTGFNLYWLATGKGPMLVDGELWSELDQFVDVQRLDGKQDRKDMTFSRGFLETELGLSIEDCRQWVIDYETAHKPYREGQTVLIDTKATNDGVYVICLGSTYQLVRIKHELNGNLTVQRDSMLGDGELITDTMSQGEIDRLGICGRIRWGGGRL